MPKVSGVKSNKVLFAIISFLSFLFVGFGIVLPSWVAFHIGGSRLVGLVLMSSSVTGMVVSPFTGHVVDRRERRQIAMVGQAIRAGALLLIAPAPFANDVAAAILLMAAAGFGALGYALQDGALAGLLQAIVPAEQRVAFVMRLSIARQIGLAAGTGIAGLSIARFGSSMSAVGFTAMAAACVFLVWMIKTPGREVKSPQSEGMLASSREALTYLVSNSMCLVASVTVGVSFAVIKITNLLLPGFVVRALDGNSSLFGTLEMMAAICGTAAVAIASLPRFVRHIEKHTLFLLTMTGLALVVFSFVRTPFTAVIVYSLAGMAWSVTRSAANGHLLTVVDTGLMGRVQAFTTLLTGIFGVVIFLMPLIAPETAEGTLYLVCGICVIAAALGLRSRGRTS
ncbi:MFS transporter [Mesorhizobium sp. Cs1299R1N1]|uniref:MFS transporter n=1 Tax=Mesorhizobium sp. Cs1299R1N1 TaxID=3015172 RepID=UPI00301CB2F1